MLNMKQMNDKAQRAQNW